jgi:hypothetical protein
LEPDIRRIDKRIGFLFWPLSFFFSLSLDACLPVGRGEGWGEGEIVGIVAERILEVKK